MVAALTAASGGCGAVESAVCGDAKAKAEAEAECPAVTKDGAQDATEEAPTATAEATAPDAAECKPFVDHFVVLTAQTYGAPATGFFTDAEVSHAVEHCVKYGHSRLIECAEETQVSNYFQTCLHAGRVTRPRLAVPSREDCERVRDRTIVIGDALQSRTTGMVTPRSERSMTQMVDHCIETMSNKQVQCASDAKSQLDLYSCFSPYQHDFERSWPTAEECETHANQLTQRFAEYHAAPYPKPQDMLEALQLSQLSGYAVPGVQRMQLLSMCLQLDRELVQCHSSATSIAELGTCVP